MSKDPAFLFYSKDWLEGTGEMSATEKGIYIDLLAHQHQKRSLPLDTSRLARIVRLSEKDFLESWEYLKDKFEVIENRFVNKKLQQVMQERADKGLTNTITGTFASLLRISNLSAHERGWLKNHFCDTFKEYPREQIKGIVTEWFEKRLKSIANGNEDVDVNVNGDRDLDEGESTIDFKKLNKELTDQQTFDCFWRIYDKNIDKEICEAKWKELDFETQRQILYQIEEYIESTPDKMYRKNPANYLENKAWLNEIIDENYDEE